VGKISEGRLPKATLQPPLAAIKGDAGLKKRTQETGEHGALKASRLSPKAPLPS